jgi:uncharacterized protein YndB with AHSA1/START domain
MFVTGLIFNIPVNAPPDKVFSAIATQTGMRGRWTRNSTKTPEVGGKAEFGFHNRAAVFRMTSDAFKPNQSVRMTCSGDHPERNGTTLDWTVVSTPEASTLTFAHRGWREMTDSCASCNSMWGNLMFRLRAFVETGKPDSQWTA